jgi:hypothetical protein
LHRECAYKCHICCDLSKCATLPASCARRLLKGLGCACLLHSELWNSAECLFLMWNMKVHCQARCVGVASVDSQALPWSIEGKGMNRKAGGLAGSEKRRSSISLALCLSLTLKKAKRRSVLFEVRWVNRKGRTLCCALHKKIGAPAEAEGMKQSVQQLEASESWSTLRITQLCWITVTVDFVRGSDWKKGR